MLGISVYLKTFDENYIQQAAANGAKLIFTSLHIPEDDFSQVKTTMQKLLKLCQQYQLTLVPDISPKTFEVLQLPKDNFQALHDLGLTALRIDYGFNDWQLLRHLQKDFTLFLNASTIDQAYLNEAQKNGINLNQIHAAHNFYPKAETGLSKEYFAELNAKYQGTAIKLLAFVPGDELKRFPLYQGLPTLEAHRGKNPYVSAVELINRFKIDDVIIGDPQAKLTTLAAINLYQTEKTMTIPLITNDTNAKIFEQDYPVRRDIADKLVRIITPRTADIPIQQTGERPLGTLTQDNLLSGRYSGELQIAKQNLPFNEKTNIIGYVHPEYLDLLQFIDSTTKLHFIRA